MFPTSKLASIYWKENYGNFSQWLWNLFSTHSPFIDQKALWFSSRLKWENSRQCGTSSEAPVFLQSCKSQKTCPPTLILSSEKWLPCCHIFWDRPTSTLPQWVRLPCFPVFLDFWALFLNFEMFLINEYPSYCDSLTKSSQLSGAFFLSVSSQEKTQCSSSLLNSGKSNCSWKMIGL